METSDFKLSGYSIPRGQVKNIKIKVTEIYMSTAIHIPVHVMHGRQSGPVVTILSSIHGDELNGIEMIRQIQKEIDPKHLSGTLVLVAIANPISFILQQRDMPDGKDLNRAFPGNLNGTLSSILAYKIFRKVILPATYVIDLHTAGHGRVNLPYVRANLKNRNSMKLAFLFGAEFIFNSKPLKDMLRHATEKEGKGIITFEAGEPMKFHPDAISYGVKRIKNALSGLKMYDFSRMHPDFQFVMEGHQWLKTTKGGILVIVKRPGEFVKKDEVIGFTTRPFQDKTNDIKAPYDGILIGISTKPYTIGGEGVCHIFELDYRRKLTIQRFLNNNIIKLE